MWSKASSQEETRQGGRIRRPRRPPERQPTGGASHHEVHGHRRSGTTCSSGTGVTTAEASGPEADVGHRIRRGTDLRGGQAAGPHGGCLARARGRTVVRASIVGGEVQRHGDRGGRSIGGRSWSRNGGAVRLEAGALEEE
jgi:hypothetical protein